MENVTDGVEIKYGWTITGIPSGTSTTLVDITVLNSANKIIDSKWLIQSVIYAVIGVVSSFLLFY